VAFFSDGLIIIALWIIYNDFFVAVIAFQKQVKRSQDIKFHPYYATAFCNFFIVKCCVIWMQRYKMNEN
jgi:hypothetical protein